MTVATSNPVYHSSGDCIIKTEANELIAGCKNTIIPSDGSVTSIGRYAFSGSMDMTSIVVPESVTNIEWGAFNNCNNAKLCIYEDSYAHTYAIENGLVFELIKSAVTKGDPDGDGKITVGDALSALRVAARIVPATPELIATCDIDGDGAVTVGDALSILRVAARIVDSF